MATPTKLVQVPPRECNLPVQPTASAGQGETWPTQVSVIFSKSRQAWLGRYREDVMRPDGMSSEHGRKLCSGRKRNCRRKNRGSKARRNPFTHQRLCLPANPHCHGSRVCKPLARGSSREAQAFHGLFRQLTSQLATSFHNSGNFASIRSAPRISKPS